MRIAQLENLTTLEHIREFVKAIGFKYIRASGNSNEIWRLTLDESITLSLPARIKSGHTLSNVKADVQRAVLKAATTYPEVHALIAGYGKKATSPPPAPPAQKRALSEAQDVWMEITAHPQLSPITEALKVCRVVGANGKDLLVEVPSSVMSVVSKNLAPIVAWLKVSLPIVDVVLTEIEPFDAPEPPPPPSPPVVDDEASVSARLAKKVLSFSAEFSYADIEDISPSGRGSVSAALSILRSVGVVKLVRIEQNGRSKKSVYRRAPGWTPDRLEEALAKAREHKRKPAEHPRASRDPYQAAILAAQEELAEINEKLSTLDSLLLRSDQLEKTIEQLESLRKGQS